MTTDSEHASPPGSAELPERTRTGLLRLRGAPADPSPPTAAEPPTRAATDPSSFGKRAQQAASGARFPKENEPDVAESTPPDTISLLKVGAGIAPPGPKIGGAARRLLAGAIALAVAAAVMLGFVIAGWNGGGSSAVKGSATSASSNADTSERFAALQASRQFAVSFFTYDHRKVDAYFRRVEAASTGSFRSDFVSKEATLKTVLTKLKTVATGQVADTGAGIFALADDKAVAFVAANLNASNATTKNGQRRYRVKLTLQKVKGEWLVSDFQEVV